MEGGKKHYWCDTYVGDLWATRAVVSRVDWIELAWTTGSAKVHPSYSRKCCIYHLQAPCKKEPPPKTKINLPARMPENKKETQSHHELLTTALDRKRRVKREKRANYTSPKKGRGRREYNFLTLAIREEWKRWVGKELVSEMRIETNRMPAAV